MPPFRNPFVKKPPLVNGFPTPSADSSASPAANTIANGGQTGSSRPEYTNSRASSSLSIKRKEESAEYKLSVVNDNGVYLPPSPPERKSFWQRTTSSSSTHRSMLSENEPFSISRESFESYRRSFDISARSPVYAHDSTTPRQSLESRMASPNKSALRSSSQLERPQLTEEEPFEDIGLHDETKQPAKKRGIFSRFGDSSESATAADNSRPNSSHRGFHLPGRKRGQSGQGAELGQITKPATAEGVNGGAVATGTGIIHGPPNGAVNGEKNGDDHEVMR